MVVGKFVVSALFGGASVTVGVRRRLVVRECVVGAPVSSASMSVSIRRWS